MTFLGPLLITIIVGALFFCMVQAFVEFIRVNRREPELDEMDYDNSHPDGFIRHYARVSAEVSK
ncbi:hypothetical protein ELG76_04065 [Rhizobium leguminosarum]|uniref:hypothetical protein n=1 Tax=Rhizobium leguminosarum TaxID=384 RepID=UPI00103109A4|nr:hypothetical protein [Rhizobium leguminosarum]TBG78596.1 hypothetical protein ELG76_04065 [Rhizobium leguminosarum]